MTIEGLILIPWIGLLLLSSQRAFPLFPLLNALKRTLRAMGTALSIPILQSGICDEEKLSCLFG